MQEKHLFEYAIIRLVPKVEREEFINIGVILYCSGLQFLQSKYTINEKKMAAFASDCDLLEVKDNLHAVSLICAGSDLSGPIGLLPMPERFRWLTATRSTIVQTSDVHPGFCTDAQQTLNNLYIQMVL